MNGGVYIEKVVKETTKAWLVVIRKTKAQVWLPKSQCYFMNSKLIFVPAWLARAKGLEVEEPVHSVKVKAKTPDSQRETEIESWVPQETNPLLENDPEIELDRLYEAGRLWVLDHELPEAERRRVEAFKNMLGEF